MHRLETSVHEAPALPSTCSIALISPRFALSPSSEHGNTNTEVQGKRENRSGQKLESHSGDCEVVTGSGRSGFWLHIDAAVGARPCSQLISPFEIGALFRCSRLMSNGRTLCNATYAVPLGCGAEAQSFVSSKGDEVKTRLCARLISSALCSGALN